MHDELIAVMRKHLPPSASTLHLLDVGGALGDSWAHARDLHSTIMTGAAVEWQLAPDAFDAVVALDADLSGDFLAICLAALRPGGRLIVGMTAGAASAEWVTKLETAGYTRILVEAALDDGRGLLLRGEKPHTEQRTVERVWQVAGREAQETLDTFRGRYVHLLIRQTPNKPVWALLPGDAITWDAVAASGDAPVLLAFSSLPNAVAFMQPAVLQGLIHDVHKVARFGRETAQSWSLPLLFNPKVEVLTDCELIFVPVDPADAEAPDE